MNGDSVSFLIQDLFSPWTTRLLDSLFYTGVCVGIVKITQALSSIIPGLRTYLYSKLYGQVNISERFGRWAVVTGATSSLGVAFANELARRGLDVVLVSRSYDDLIQVVSDIQSCYSVQAYGIHADFLLGQQVFDEIEEALLTDRLDIGILVNINPIKYDHPQYFSQVPRMRLWQLVNVNIAATTIITHIVLPTMLERGHGAIINVSSTLAHAPPTPLLAAEAASMGFVSILGQALHEECHRKNIIVQTLTPFKLAKDGYSSYLYPTPERYVTEALNTLTYASCCAGYWPHGLLTFLHNLIPTSWWVWFTGQRNRLTRHQCLTDGIAHQNKLFARKPRKISIFSGTSSPTRSRSPAHRTTRPSRTSQDMSPLETSFPSSVQNYPQRSLSSEGYHKPSYQRNYSRVMVIPSLVKEECSDLT